jgi:hypothetical protein
MRNTLGPSWLVKVKQADLQAVTRIIISPINLEGAFRVENKINGVAAEVYRNDFFGYASWRVSMVGEESYTAFSGRGGKQRARAHAIKKVKAASPFQSPETAKEL